MKILKRTFFILGYTIQSTYAYWLDYINKKIIIRNMEINFSLQILNKSAIIGCVKKSKKNRKSLQENK